MPYRIIQNLKNILMKPLKIKGFWALCLQNACSLRKMQRINKEYLQPLPSDDVIESYLPHDRQTTVRSDSLVTYHNCKYSVPPEYIGKPVRLLVSDNTLRIYSSTDLIAVHALSTKRMNYQKDHYQQLLTQTMKEADMVAELAEVNLKQMDAFL